MFDQAFSTANFRRIYDYENRKGHLLDSRFFPEIAEVTFELRDCARDISERRLFNRANGIENATSAELSQLYDRRSELRAKKEALLVQEFDKLCSAIESPTFALGLQKGGVVRGKPVYTSGDSAASFFALKQIQYNIYRLYKVKQSNRHNIICQLRELLADKFPKYVIRTDISGFYENIPREGMLSQLANDSLLTSASTRLVKRVLWEYSQISGADRGIPRGIGISAYLAELYLRWFDRDIRRFPGVLHYARYVDDIVVIYVPPPGRDATGLQDHITKQFKKHGLSKNTAKTSEFFVNGSQQHILEYLGYSIEFGDGKIRLDVSPKKLSRYKSRIELTLDAYRRATPHSEPVARRLLIKRLRFLTGNTRLVNNKRRARVGIHFSNSLLTDSNSLAELDSFLISQSAGIANSRVQARVQRFSFVRGFEEKTFHRFTTNELTAIVRAWKHEA